MKIESKHVTIPAKAKEVFDYLSNMNNFEELLPRERISDWESTESYCSFKVQNTATIDLNIAETKEPETIIMKSGSKSPFPITLQVFLNEVNGNTEAYQVCDAKVNTFLKMMVEKPLTNLFDHIADKLVVKFQ